MQHSHTADTKHAKDTIARSQRLMLALSHAGQAALRARTPEAIYAAIGAQVSRLGLDATVLVGNDDRTELRVSHLTLQSDLVRLSERLTGLTAQGYRIPLRPGGFFERRMTSEETVACPLTVEILAEALPVSLYRHLERLLTVLGWQESIWAPLLIGGEAAGLLCITGADLSKTDVPAVTVFANQIAIALENARLYHEAQALADFNRTIVHSMNEGILIEDGEGNLTFVNPAAASLLGYSLKALIGMHWMSLVPQDQWQLVRDANQRRSQGVGDRYELVLLRKDGQRVPVLVSGTPRFDTEGRFAGTMAVFTDITGRKRAQAEQEVTLELLRLLNSPNDLHTLIASVTRLMHSWSGCEAVGIRLQDGHDYPYFETRGFPPEFVRMEKHLCAVDSDGRLICDAVGNPVLECMCGNVIRGRFDPALPFFSANGSFWTNSTSDLLASTTEEDRQARTRNRCHGEGYESVALIPLRHSSGALGLLQFNDSRRDRFDADHIELFERLASSLTLGLVQCRAAQALQESEQRYRDLVEQAPIGIFRTTPQGKTLMTNSAMARMLGASSPEAVVRRYTDLGSQLYASAERREAFLRLLSNQGYVENFEYEARTLDGRTVWLSMNARLTDREPDQALAIEGFTIDISDRKRAEEALEKRIVALTRPLDDAAEMAFEDLFSLDDIQRLQDQFSEATRVASVITDINGMPITRPSNFCRLCRDIVRGTDRGKINCFRSDAELGRAHVNGPVIQPCMSGGLWDAGAAIMVGGRHLANWLIGQVRDETQSEAQIRRYAREIGADEEAAAAAFREVPVMSQAQFRRVAQALFTVARQLSTTAYQNVQQARFITEGKRAEEERERLTRQVGEQARRMAQVLATVPAGVLLIDARGQVLQANPMGEVALTELSGGQSGGHVVHLGGRPLAELLTSPVPAGTWHEIETEACVYEAIARPMVEESGAENWVLVIRDVTGERQRERQVQQQERLAAVGQLAAGIAHDFNNLMAVIVLYARMAISTPGLPPLTYDRLEIVMQQAKRASELIQQILDFSRRSVLEQRPLGLRPFLIEVVKLLERTLPESIRLRLRHGDEDYTVNADPTRMQQVILNLALNSRDAMPHGGELHIELSRLPAAASVSCVVCGMVPVEGWIRISVRDSGNGIPPEVLPRIFEPFYTTKDVGKGTGLGLAQVYGIVTHHEGHIGVTTEVGTGTCFDIYLPPLKARQSKKLLADGHSLVMGRGETLLVVEDDVVLRTALVESLGALNYQVVAALNGHEALEVLTQQSGQISLVLSDMVMPEMGGRALFRAMQQRGLRVPVVILSGHPMEAELARLEAEGLGGWMLKPPDIEGLSRLLSQVLARHAAV